MVETYVSDLARSTDFYSRLLGAGPLHSDETHAHFKVISHDLILTQTPTNETVPAHGPTRFGLEVVDAVAYHFLLQARGVQAASSPARSAEGWMVGRVEDPDGHIVEYVQKDAAR